MSDRDPRFTSRFWPKLQRALGIALHFSIAFHPQIDDQSERTIQTLEDMLRACVLDFKGNWAKYLTLVEFAYNNSYQASISMAPYEALYRRKFKLQSAWMKWVNESSVMKNSLKFQLKRFKLSRKDLKLLRIVKRAMVILDGKIWNLKWMISYFSRFLL